MTHLENMYAPAAGDEVGLTARVAFDAAWDIDPGCSAHVPASVLLADDSLPLHRTDGGVVIATARRGGASLLGTWFPGESLLFRQADRRDVQEQVVALRSDEVAAEMANGFTGRFPEFAARTGIMRWQKAVACLAGLAVLGLLYVGGVAAIAVVTGLVFSAGVLFKILLAVAAAGRRGDRPGLPELSDDELPTYTVLIPAYQEEDVIGDTVRCIADLDYPKDKLEVLVLVERRDIATKQAIRAASPPDFVRIVELPPGLPQTKPRSCNLGLMLARGELLVIFDAEDRPERDQLRAAARHFATGGEKLACVQARLNFYNRHRNFLTRMFSLEYAFWFDLMLVGLDRLRLPVPLGGTSNHVRTAALRQVGGWDAWNVTEDADLGLRFAACGYRVAVIDSTTWEECPARPWSWIMQRTRWLKGYVLTLMVHTRRPAQAARRFRLRGLLSLAGVVGGTPAVFLTWPFALALGMADELHGPWGGPLAGWAQIAAAMTWGAMLMMIVAVLIAGYRRRMDWAMAALIPVYWLLHAIAAWRGLVQLVRAPYRWEKTVHRAAPTAGCPAPTRSAARR